MSYYFNWNELLRKSKKDYDSIIVLTYASMFGYNKKIANSSLDLVKKLHINRIPNWLNSSLIMNDKSFEIFNNYRVEEPQSYFNNASFLKAVTPVAHKIQYLWLLSHRRNDDKSSFIKRDFFKIKEIDGLRSNPFITIGKERISFTLENTYTPRT